MTAIVLANALAMSEFQGYTGDCTQTAMLCCAHVLDPVRFPLNAATLNTLVTHDIAINRASATGAETLDGAAADFKDRGFTIDQYGYAEPLAYDWHTSLILNAGHKPILLQVANGAAFGIESTLHYHAVAILGHDFDTQQYVVADGDNPACAGGRCVLYSIQQITAASPCGLIVVHTPPPPPPPDPKQQLLALAAQLTAGLQALP